jgi:hypothetical protein
MLEPSAVPEPGADSSAAGPAVPQPFSDEPPAVVDAPDAAVVVAPPAAVVGLAVSSSSSPQAAAVTASAATTATSQRQDRFVTPLPPAPLSVLAAPASAHPDTTSELARMLPPSSPIGV